MKNLATYLNDHGAGARFAIEMLNRLNKSHEGTPFGEFVDRMHDAIEEGYAALQSISQQFAQESAALKEAATWLAERASRLKLELGNEAKFAAFESLEVLSLGVLGKHKLWQTLQDISPGIVALQGVDYETLIERARSQHEEIEAWRQKLGREALGSAAE